MLLCEIENESLSNFYMNFLFGHLNGVSIVESRPAFFWIEFIASTYSETARL
jgi:hypothetical protein